MTESMSDEEIRENLLKLGQNIGPVVDSTRAFYRRKLAKLLGEIKDEPVPNSSDAEGSASENETYEEKEEHVQEELFSRSYIPPAEIRGRRSTNTNAESSPPKPLRTKSISFRNAPVLTANELQIIIAVTFVLSIIGLIIYYKIFNGFPIKTAIESQ